MVHNELENKFQLISKVIEKGAKDFFLFFRLKES